MASARGDLGLLDFAVLLMPFSVQTGGRGYVRQHDRFADLAAGTGVLSEARSPRERISQAALTLSLRFPRELLPLAPYRRDHRRLCTPREPGNPGHADAVPCLRRLSRSLGTDAGVRETADPTNRPQRRSTR
jgi:hypothetical protein